jgi:hypothetical protein
LLSRGEREEKRGHIIKANVIKHQYQLIQDTRKTERGRGRDAYTKKRKRKRKR